MPKLRPALSPFSLDTETTGVDLYHGAKPYLVTFCEIRNGKPVNDFYEWDVDPLTREPIYEPVDLAEIQATVQRVAEQERLLILQNPSFDTQALSQTPDWRLVWPWGLTRCTLVAGHLLASNHAHSLDAMAVEYLGTNIKRFEDELERACKEARNIARSRYKEWRVAKEGLPEMPSAKNAKAKGKSGKDKTERGSEDNKPWKFDAWLPRAIAKAESYPAEHPWWTVCSKYANVDSATTLALWLVQEKILKQRGLWNIYLERLKVLPIKAGMESRGVTINMERLETLSKEYAEGAGIAERRCLTLSEGTLTKLPKSGTSKALKETIFHKLRLPVFNVSKKTREPSVDKKAMEFWLATIEKGTKGYSFVKNLQGYRKRTTALTYMVGYKRFARPWIPAWDGTVDEETGAGWYVLHPSLNPTGTDTLRWSSSNPNEQNIGKGGVDDEDPHSLRYCFGPAPGREWWSMDAKNIELRIPAYESGEQELIDLFEHPDDPPYYGSTHLLNFHTVYPDLWNKELKLVGDGKVGPHCKKKYASTWYQWCKNGGFAVQYGAIEREKGTADIAFHKDGAHSLLKRRFSRLDTHNQWCINFANKHGYIETLPDIQVDAKRGYPLLCTRSQWGDIKPTIPLNYRTQGTACWEMMRGMIVVQAKLDDLNARDSRGWYMTMQIHDEIVLDFPYVANKGNLPIIMDIKARLDKLGDDLRPAIPIRYGVEYHQHTWNKGEVCV